MARVRRLTALELRHSETHGRREDDRARARKVRDEPSITWVPEGVDGDPLALSERLADHTAGAFVPKGTGKALHMLVKLPESVPVETREDAERALDLVVGFAQAEFGGRAVFAARMDRDERALNNCDVFLAPIYDKVTKRASKPAVSLSRHLKLIASRRGYKVDGADTLRMQGRALQDAFHEWLTAAGYEATRGKPKESKGDDWVQSEVAGARLDREAAERAKAETAEMVEGVRAERQRLNEDARGLGVAIMEQDEKTKRAAVEAERVVADAKRQAASILEAAQRRAREFAELQAVAEVERRRKADETAERSRRVEAAERAVEDRAKAVDAERAIVAAERVEVGTMRAGLAKLIETFERLMKPIRAMALDWTKASPMVRQAMGTQGPAAKKIVDSAEVAKLAHIASQMSGQGR